MDLLLRYFDEIDYNVKVGYHDSQFFGHGTSKDVQKQFNNAISELDPNKLFQVGMDGPNVNLREKNQQHGLIYIGSCGLHTMRNTFKTGAKQTDWKVKKILKAACQIFHDSLARREDYYHWFQSVSFIILCNKVGEFFHDLFVYLLYLNYVS